MPGWGVNRCWGGDVGISVFLPNDLADIFDGESVWEWWRVGCRRVALFSYTVIVVGEG
jgi:hypothetical protein